MVSMMVSVQRASGVTSKDECAQLLQVFAHTVAKPEPSAARFGPWSETVAPMLPPQPKHQFAGGLPLPVTGDLNEFTVDEAAWRKKVFENAKKITTLKKLHSQPN